MSVLVCGSIAFDTIMLFNDKFKHHILPEKVHILNVSFMVPEMRREFGGCAGNIAYNLKLLGGEPLIMATVGADFAPYAAWMDKCGIKRDHIKVIDNSYTAQAFITTDMDDNQITAFHPGAMMAAHENKISQAQGVELGIVSPDGRDGMLQHAEQFAAAGIPFIFDPGQGMPMFDGADLRHFIDLANWIVVNDYEWQLMQERTQYTIQQVTELVQALIVTQGGEGSTIYTREHTHHIPSVKVAQIVDPTGCGDAYRAGLLYGLTHNWDLVQCGQVASLLGAYKIEHPGTQNHNFTLSEFKQRYVQNFGSALSI